MFLSPPSHIANLFCFTTEVFFFIFWNAIFFTQCRFDSKLFNILKKKSRYDSRGEDELAGGADKHMSLSQHMLGPANSTVSVGALALIIVLCDVN